MGAGPFRGGPPGILAIFGAPSRRPDAVRPRAAGTRCLPMSFDYMPILPTQRYCRAKALSSLGRRLAYFVNGAIANSAGARERHRTG